MITHIRMRAEGGYPHNGSKALCGTTKRFLYASEVPSASIFSGVEICEECMSHPDYVMYALAHAGQEEESRSFSPEATTRIINAVVSKSTCIGRNA